MSDDSSKYIFPVNEKYKCYYCEPIMNGHMVNSMGETVQPPQYRARKILVFDLVLEVYCCSNGHVFSNGKGI